MEVVITSKESSSSIISNNYLPHFLKIASHLPSFNGKPYYEFRDFGFEDFEYMPYDTLKSYKQENISSLYEYLFAHFEALATKAEIEEARELYANSILLKPEYFQYAEDQELLKEMYIKIAGNKPD